LTAIPLFATIGGREESHRPGTVTMAKKAQKSSSPGEAERKRRTREHVIADLSVHHVEGLALKCGYTVQRIVADYGHDLLLATYNEAGEVEANYVLLQLKASDGLQEYELAQEEVFSFPVSQGLPPVEGWPTAVFLILYDAQLGRPTGLTYRNTQQPSSRPEENPCDCASRVATSWVYRPCG
jgi:hypothetical protein